MSILLIVAGPTAVGKTAASIRLAQHFGTVVVSADSRQFYREMYIGTARPSPEEEAQVKHYFTGTHSIHDEVNAGRYEREALSLLEELFRQHTIVVMTGGSGLYIDAVCNGIDEMPDVSPELRQTLKAQLAEQGLPSLLERLANIDPEYYARVDRANPQRVLRAIEVIESTGMPYSAFRKGGATPRPFRIIKVGLDLPRELLYERINHRVDNMIEAGLEKEVAALYPYRHLNALQTVGYREFFDVIDGLYTREKAIELVKQHTRNYAKRQLTWFRRYPDIHWFHPDNTQALIALATGQQ
jgi:tRNA dimethylallyltransferase